MLQASVRWRSPEAGRLAPLRPSLRRRKTTLPTYPFQRKRFWRSPDAGSETSHRSRSRCARVQGGCRRFPCRAPSGPYCRADAGLEGRRSDTPPVRAPRRRPVRHAVRSLLARGSGRRKGHTGHLDLRIGLSVRRPRAASAKFPCRSDRGHGGTVVEVRAGPHIAREPMSRFYIAPDRPEDFERLWSELDAAGHAAGVVDAGRWTPRCPRSSARVLSAEAPIGDVNASARQGGIWLLSCGAVDACDDPLGACAGAVCGPGKVLALECCRTGPGGSHRNGLEDQTCVA